MPPAEKPFPFRIEFPPELPISGRAEEITAAIAANQVVILAGETGSGKTTQIPKMCLAAGRGGQGRIACTQPRRVAALSISRRVADELGVDWGREVGCKVRFADQTSRQTIVKFLTDGMLLAELQSDPLLREYDTVIIDEAHERSLNIDFLLGHLRQLRFRRPELKVIITSATIDTVEFSAAFDDAPVIVVEGRTYPVETIYAPLDELGRDYTEGDENEDDDAEATKSAKAEALHYIDGTVEAIERILRESTDGDVLAFLPAERDIREMRELLEGRLSSLTRGRSPVEIVPLFGRLSNAEQQRVFARTQGRKVVLATNIAETSLTIPGIRYVVDSGLARISRYSPQSRTRRLPIEPVAQSSAEQRKGRAGRVAEGVCIRLYSEKDYLERPRFTQPEIQRANLADVILRMKAYGLGDIERFPFINLPAAKAIRAGYALLQELGAVETADRAGSGPPQTPEGSENEKSAGTGAGPSSQLEFSSGAPIALTAIGHELARLPVDPTVGRMILQARAEKALREVVVIAAGLSIQDPRERPLDRQQQADTAHRRFAHPDSDFLTLLNIWDAFHGDVESLSQARLRRFCREHFLSYPRMREWRDIHAQLLDVLGERDDFKLTSALDALRRIPAAKSDEPGLRLREGKSHVRGRPEKVSGVRQAQSAQGGGRDVRRRESNTADPFTFGGPAYRAVHRSILSGLLGNIACFDEDNGGYKSTHDRRVALFPGSVLFRREESKKQNSKAAAQGSPPRKSPRWIMAAEIVETTRMYARTCARLDPQWALELAGHLVRVAHSEPFWNESGGRVLVRQRTRLYGLELDSRAVGYGRIDPVHATEIFIREGLVNDTIQFPLDFIDHNRAVRDKIEDLLTRARDSGYLNLDEAAFRFYAERLSPHEGRDRTAVSSVSELVDLLRQRQTAEPKFLFMTPEDLRDPTTIEHDAAAFPSAVPLENRALPLHYAYKPGQTDDGVTVTVNVRQAENLTPAALDWAVPGHVEPKVEHYLRALPKELRRGFVPLADTARNLATELRERTDSWRQSQMSLADALALLIAERQRIAIDPIVWADKPPPEHLRVRIRVVDAEGNELSASRDLRDIRAALLARSREASRTIAKEEPTAWRAARAQWETSEHQGWAFDRVPERVLVTEDGGAPVFAFPGLQVGSDGVARRLFKSPEEAARDTARAIIYLFDRALSRDLMWTERDLRSLRELGPLVATLAPIPPLPEQAFESIRRWITDAARLSRASGDAGTDSTEAWNLTSDAFAGAVEQARGDLRGLVPRLLDLLREILTLRQQLLVLKDPPPQTERILANLLPADFVRRTPFRRLSDLPRYLRGVLRRADRWRKNPSKDAERLAQIAPYERAAMDLVEALPKSRLQNDPIRVQAVESFRWLVEEFRVSLFAQELGTAEPVSAVKLDRALAALRSESVNLTGPKSGKLAPPIIAVPVQSGETKTTPLKNLGALDKLFRR